RRMLATPATPSHRPRQRNNNVSTSFFVAPMHGTTAVNGDSDSGQISSNNYSSPLQKQLSAKRPREQDPDLSTNSSKEQHTIRRRVLMASNQLISSTSIPSSSTSPVLSPVSTPIAFRPAIHRIVSEAPDLRESAHHSVHFWGPDKSRDSNVDVGGPAMDGSTFSHQRTKNERGSSASREDKDNDQGSSSGKEKHSGDEEQGLGDNGDTDDENQDSDNARQGDDDNGSDGDSDSEDGDDENSRDDKVEDESEGDDESKDDDEGEDDDE
ncbi:hypothetical protein BGZ50_000327, partial [Haplosporangium sp. Z 11]